MQVAVDVILTQFRRRAALNQCTMKIIAYYFTVDVSYQFYYTFTLRQTLFDSSPRTLRRVEWERKLILTTSEEYNDIVNVVYELR